MDSMSDTCFCDLGSIPEVADVDYDYCYSNNKKKFIFITTFSVEGTNDGEVVNLPFAPTKNVAKLSMKD